MIVAIDGPAGSGKGTIAKNLARKFNLLNIDTGAMYRAVTLKLLNENIDVNDKEAIIDCARSAKIELSSDGKVLLDDKDVTSDIRSTIVTDNVSIISPIKEVRDIMKEKQRSFAKENSIVMEGRDITTEIFPNADYKFYLDADVEVRAKRRYDENIAKGIECDYEEILSSIKERDYNDMHRKDGALKIAKDAVYIDTTNLNIEEVTKKIVDIINKK